jgi:hypothetical protein
VGSVSKAVLHAWRSGLAKGTLLTKEEVTKLILKLHLQWGHPRVEGMQAVLSSAGASKEAIEAVQEVHDSCPTCKFLHSRYFRKPCSSMPKYRQFLECLRVDFLYIEPGVYFLHAVDSFSRYNLGQIVFSRSAESTCQALLRSVLTRPFPPKKIVFDRDGGFVNAQVVTLLEGLNVAIGHTATEAHHSAGVVERAHITVSELARAVRLDLGENIPWEHIDQGVLAAVNVLHNNHGSSPAKIVYGIDPYLPDTLAATPPQQKPYADMPTLIRHHHLALNSARSAYFNRDVVEKINTALRCNVKPTPSPVFLGERVYYYREKGPKQSTGWRGPAEVVGVKQDGTVYLDHGGMWVTVSDRRVLEETLATDTVLMDPNDRVGWHPLSGTPELGDTPEPARVERELTCPPPAVNPGAIIVAPDEPEVELPEALEAEEFPIRIRTHRPDFSPEQHAEVDLADPNVNTHTHGTPPITGWWTHCLINSGRRLGLG